MIKVPLFDLHCDTFLKLYNTKQNIINNSLHISLNKARFYEPYIQVASIWSDNTLSNEDAYSSCLNAIKYAKSLNINNISTVNSLCSPAFIFGVEDARILDGYISRLYKLYSLGVRVLTLNWKGSSCIGGGWDTSNGLTDFGKSVIKHCKSTGITVDLSHSSVTTFFDVVKMAYKLDFIPIASHSNSLSICNHGRNLSDEQFRELKNLNSVVGISLAPEHLGKDASIYHILKHIDHYLMLGGENNVCLGCDFDGVSSLPSGIDSIESILILYYELLRQFGVKTTEKIFFYNAYNFFLKHLR